MRQCVLAQHYIINRFPGTKPCNEPNVALPAKRCWPARKMTITLDSLLIQEVFFNLHCRLNKTRATSVLHHVKHSKLLANVGRTQELLSSRAFSGKFNRFMPGCHFLYRFGCVLLCLTLSLCCFSNAGSTDMLHS